MISLSSSGSFKNLDRFLSTMSRNEHFRVLEKYGQMGVDALASATPTESGLTAQSWTYRVVRKGGRYSIEWNNTKIPELASISLSKTRTPTSGMLTHFSYLNGLERNTEATFFAIWQKS